MYRKSLFSLIIGVGVCLTGFVGVYAQTAPVSGKVEMDGTHAPVVGALVEVYQTDIKSGFPSAKTDSKGEFHFAGMRLGATYAFSISAEGCSPQIFPNVKAGEDKLLITLSPGDGKKLTEAEVRTGVAQTGKTGSTQSPTDKKAKEEYDKQVAENQAQRKKAEDTNKIISESLKEGVAAFQAQNYDLAITKFNEGYNADPDFEGSAPILLVNKGLAYRERGIATFRAAASGDAAAKAAAMEKAKPDFTEANAAFERALEILAKAPAGDAATQNAYAKTRNDALRDHVNTDAVMGKLNVDPAKTQEAGAFLDKYVASETDEAMKGKTVLNWANYMRDGGDMKNAIHGYRIVMAKTPDNIDAEAGLGLSLFNEGVSSVPENKEEMQEGLNLMQKFADTAPDSHPLKASVKDAVDYLKNTAKLAPQKVTTTKKKP